MHSSSSVSPCAHTAESHVPLSLPTPGMTWSASSRVVRLGSRGGLGLSSWCFLGLRRLLVGLGSRSGRLAGRSFRLRAIRRRPQSEVVAKKLHDQRAVTVRLLGEAVELSDSIVERLFREMAGTIWRVQDLVIEDREVQSEAKTDWVSRGKLSLSDIGSVLALFSLCFQPMLRWVECYVPCRLHAQQ